MQHYKSLLCCNFRFKCSDELNSLLPTVWTFNSRTIHTTSRELNHQHFTRVLNVRRKLHSDIFPLRAATLNNRLHFSEYLNINLLKSIVIYSYPHNPHFLPSFSSIHIPHIIPHHRSNFNTLYWVAHKISLCDFYLTKSSFVFYFDLHFKRSINILLHMRFFLFPSYSLTGWFTFSISSFYKTSWNIYLIDTEWLRLIHIANIHAKQIVLYQNKYILLPREKVHDSRTLNKYYLYLLLNHKRNFAILWSVLY